MNPRAHVELKSLNADEYAQRARSYLAAASETTRRPRPSFVGIEYWLMVVAQSYALNLLLADCIAIGSTPWTQQTAAWGLCVLSSVVFIGIAESVGKSQYIQSLAYYANKGAPPGISLRRTHTWISIENNNADQTELPAIRMINRSDRVAHVLGSEKRVGKVSPALLWVAAITITEAVTILVFYVYDLEKRLGASAHINYALAAVLAVVPVLTVAFAAKMAYSYGFASDLGNEAWKIVRKQGLVQ